MYYVNKRNISQLTAQKLRVDKTKHLQRVNTKTSTMSISRSQQRKRKTVVRTVKKQHIQKNTIIDDDCFSRFASTKPTAVNGKYYIVVESTSVMKNILNSLYCQERDRCRSHMRVRKIQGAPEYVDDYWERLKDVMALKYLTPDPEEYKQADDEELSELPSIKQFEWESCIKTLASVKKKAREAGDEEPQNAASDESASMSSESEDGEDEDTQSTRSVRIHTVKYLREPKRGTTKTDDATKNPKGNPRKDDIKSVTKPSQEIPEEIPEVYTENSLPPSPRMQSF